jgi:hypothetical protein
MILTHNELVALLRKLDKAREAAVEGTLHYCSQSFAGEQRDGVHGRGFLGIDTDTNDVVCTECRKR